jgi:hypothetical protein
MATVNLNSILPPDEREEQYERNRRLNKSENNPKKYDILHRQLGKRHSLIPLENDSDDWDDIAHTENNFE